MPHSWYDFINLGEYGSADGEKSSKEFRFNGQGWNCAVAISSNAQIAQHPDHPDRQGSGWGSSGGNR